MTFLNSFQAQAYALFRIFFGFCFLWHGTQKFFDFPLAYPYGPLSTMTTIAGAIELIAGVCIMIGFLTRPMAFLASGLMAAAYWIAHGMQSFFPIVNHGELAVLYCFAFLYIATQGAGIWSVDKNK